MFLAVLRLVLGLVWDTAAMTGSQLWQPKQLRHKARTRETMVGPQLYPRLVGLYVNHFNVC